MTNQSADEKTIKAIENMIETNVKTNIGIEVQVMFSSCIKNTVLLIFHAKEKTYLDSYITEIPYNHHIDPIPMQEVLDRLNEERILGNL